MSLRSDWVSAKKEAEKLFAKALDAKIAKLNKEAKEGDEKAREKVIQQSLREAGLGPATDLEDYFTFKQDFGPNLDKLEAAAEANREVSRKKVALGSVEQIVADARLAEPFGRFCKKVQAEEFWSFIPVGYKMNADLAYDRYIPENASMMINLKSDIVQQLTALAEDRPRLKREGPPILKKAREALIRHNADHLLEHFKSDNDMGAQVFGAKEGLDPLKKTIEATMKSYETQIKSFEADWRGVVPDFRKPLTDELKEIGRKIDAL
jgi:hypothetical protein